MRHFYCLSSNYETSFFTPVMPVVKRVKTLRTLNTRSHEGGSKASLGWRPVVHSRTILLTNLSLLNLKLSHFDISFTKNFVFPPTGPPSIPFDLWLAPSLRAQLAHHLKGEFCFLGGLCDGMVESSMFVSYKLPAPKLQSSNLLPLSNLPSSKLPRSYWLPSTKLLPSYKLMPSYKLSSSKLPSYKLPSLKLPSSKLLPL